MGKQKYLTEVEGLFERSAIVDSASIARLVKSKKPVKQYPKQLIRNLVLKKKIKRLAKGCYTKHGEPSLAVFCFSPAYLGLQDALSYHNLWGQETIAVIVTTRKVRTGIRRIIGTNVLIRRLNKKYFFGFKQCKQGDFYLPYSDMEKTLIDMVYFKERISNEAIKNLRNLIDKKKLGNYLKAYPKQTRQRVWNIFRRASYKGDR